MPTRQSTVFSTKIRAEEWTVISIKPVKPPRTVGDSHEKARDLSRLNLRLS